MTAKTRKQQLEEMLSLEPNDPFLRYGLAMEYVSEGKDDAAVERFHEMFEVAPDYVPAYLQAGQALVRLGNAEKAREVFLRGVETARKQGDHHAAEEMTGMLSMLE